MKKQLRFFILFIAFLLVPVISNSCPMCQGAPSNDTIFAYKGITLFLALLPIIGAGGIYFWIYLRSKKIKEHTN